MARKTTDVPNKIHVNLKSAVDAPPVAFVQLFRYATILELFLNTLGLVAAVAAGATQPLMTIVFGNLAQKFLSFSLSEAAYLRNSDNPNAIIEFQAAAADFRNTATTYSLYLVYLGIGTLVCTFVYMVIWVYTGEVNAKRIREKYLEATLRQDIAYFDTVGVGEVTNHIQTDTHLVQQGISEKVAIFVNLLATFFTGFILAYIRCWRLALAMSSVLPCIAIAGGFMTTLVSKYTRLSLQHIADSSTLAEEVITSIRTANAFGAQKILTSLYDVHIRRARLDEAKSAVVNGAGMGVFFFILTSAYALAFEYGSRLINEGYANAGLIVNVLMSIMIGSFSLIMMAPEMQAITTAQGAAAKLFATIERIPDIDSSNPEGLKPKGVVGEITFENVKFNYPTRPNVPIINGLDITFTAGQTAALVGCSGSGKSTIISLIERFYDPLCGTVKLDGIDIRDLNIKWLRSQIGLVSQEPTLFATTITENIAHGLINTRFEHVSEEEKFKMIKEACIRANADGFISKLPQGYGTMVGERGFLLSGGQKQRVAIARAIVSDPRILLLDEATSALDTRSEGIVQDALDKASAGRTTIIIAHRLSTIKDADCIYVIGEGQVLEKGTHLELLENEDSTYSRLVNAQKLRETTEGQRCNSTTTVDDEEDREKDEETEDLLSHKAPTPVGLAQTWDDDRKPEGGDDAKHSMLYLFTRIGLLNRDGLWRYAVGSICAIRMAYPTFGIVYGQAIAGFGRTDPSVRQHDGNMNALWVFIIATLSTISAALQTYFFAYSATILTSRIRSLSFKAILRQDIEYFDRAENNTGALTADLGDNSQKISGLAGVTLGTLVQSQSTLMGGSIIGLIYAWKPSLIGIACMPFLMSTGIIRLHVVVLKDQHNKGVHQTSALLACEAISAPRTVASLTREEDCLRLYSESLEEPLRKSKWTAIWSNLIYAISQSMILFIIALVFWYGARLVSHREIGTKAFFVSLFSTTFGAMQAGNTFAFVPDISSAHTAAASIIKLIDSAPDNDTKSPAVKTPEKNRVQGRIQLENVHFRYPTRPSVPVLRDLSIVFEPGKYVALVGPSGCGKSTVIQLIERFYEPLLGRILLDGNPINEINVQEYRKQIALVSQEPTLYAGTIRFNILLGANKPESEVNQDEIEAACRDANILDFIKSLPNGFDTQVGGKGSQLSGGQKQRIAIARALLRNPTVLLLDEATSALDSDSENVVQAALDQAAKGRTTVAIAHRLSTIQNADRIYFMKDGRVTEAGTHDELLSLHGDYYEHVRLQVLKK